MYFFRKTKLKFNICSVLWIAVAKYYVIKTLDVHGIGLNFLCENMIVFVLWFKDESYVICVSMSQMEFSELILLHLLVVHSFLLSFHVPLKTKLYPRLFVVVMVSSVFGWFRKCYKYDSQICKLLPPLCVNF